jgi:hypothetical protein
MCYKFNPFTSNFDLDSSKKNFSFTKIESPIVIEQNQQMIINGAILIKDEFKINGSFICRVFQKTHPRNIRQSEYFKTIGQQFIPDVIISGVARVSSDLRIFKLQDVYSLLNPVVRLFRIRKDRYYFAKRIKINAPLKLLGTLNIGAN